MQRCFVIHPCSLFSVPCSLFPFQDFDLDCINVTKNDDRMVKAPSRALWSLCEMLARYVVIE
jgi:hypothetical protein